MKNTNPITKITVSNIAPVRFSAHSQTLQIQIIRQDGSKLIRYVTRLPQGISMRYVEARHKQYGDPEYIMQRILNFARKHAWDQQVTGTFWGGMVISFTRPEPQNEFVPVLVLGRDDIRVVGYDPTRLSDKELAEFAWGVGESEPVMIQFWDSLVAECDLEDLPRLEFPCPTCKKTVVPENDPSDGKPELTCPACGYLFVVGESENE